MLSEDANLMERAFSSIFYQKVFIMAVAPLGVLAISTLVWKAIYLVSRLKLQIKGGADSVAKISP
jgi:hypothetical protein